MCRLRPRLAQGEGDREEQRQIQRDGGAGRAADVVRRDEPQKPADERAQDRIAVVFAQVPRDVARGGGGQDEQGVDDHEADPAHGERHDDRDADREERLVARGRDAARGRERRVDGREHQPVRGEHPQHGDREQHGCKQADLPRRDREDVADQILVELCEAPAAERRDEDAERDRGRGEHADERVGRLARAAADVGEQQREQNREADGPVDRERRAAEDAHGDAREARVAQRVGEEAHAARDDHGREDAEERRHDEHGQQRVFHEVEREKIRRDETADRVPETHCAAPPPMWNA